MIVRENSEGEYSTIGGRFGAGTATRPPFRRPSSPTRESPGSCEYAAGWPRADAADHVGDQVQRHHPHDAVLGEVVGETLGTHPGIRLESVLIDALAAKMVLHPDSMDVVVASNLFGDILSDLAAAMAGSIGIAPSANLNPERLHPSMFEPVHGSAPDIAGQGIANPVGAMWAGAMMLDHLEEHDAAAQLTTAFERAIADGVSTADLGGTASTSEFTAAVLENIGDRRGLFPYRRRPSG